MDALFKALGARGYDVEVTEPEVVRGRYDNVETKKPTETRVRVGEEWLSFSIVEHTELDPPTPKRPKFGVASREEMNAWYSRPRQVRKPSGRRTLQIDTGSFLHTRGSWNDTAKRGLEDCLNDFVRGLLTRAEAVRLNRVQNEERERQWKEQRERQEREQRRREEDAKRASEIEAELAAWRLARDIRAYVAELHDVLAKGDCTITPDGPFDRKLKWALEHAEKIDPVASLQRDIVAMHARHKETCDACREGREHDHKRDE